MSANKIFFDSNILVYLVDRDEVKKRRVVSLLSPDCIISTQVVNENVNACLRSKERKGIGLSKQEAFAHGRMLLKKFEVRIIHTNTIDRAFAISEKYHFSFWDSLIISTALEYNCNILYSEDLANGQIIEKQLKIINPFKEN